MKAYRYGFALLVILWGCRNQYPENHLATNWFVDDTEETNTEPYGIQVRSVRLTPQYTILDVRFTNRGKRFLTNKGKQLPVGFIWVSSNARLTTPDGSRAFRFIKADGIPILPKLQRVGLMDQLSFALYFDRLDKGIETVNWSDYARKDDPHHRYTVHNLHVENPPGATITEPQPLVARSLISMGGTATMQAGDKITLGNLYFEPTKADLLPASFDELDQLVVLLQNNPTMTIRIEGHTDVIGDHKKNRQLSQDRAAACRHYLMQKGVAANRIQAVGYGDTRPVDRKPGSVNRRVEFVILTV